MILMNCEHGAGDVQRQAPDFFGVVDHPVVPRRAADREVGHIGVQVSRKDEEVNSPRGVELALEAHALAHSGFPITAEIDGLVHIQVPTLSDHQEIPDLRGHLLGCLDEIGH